MWLPLFFKEDIRKKIVVEILLATLLSNTIVHLKTKYDAFKPILVIEIFDYWELILWVPSHII